MTRSTGTVLITGATGFAGSRMIEEFRRAGWHTHGTSQRPDREGYHHLSLEDLDSIQRTVASVRPDVVVHLAGVAHRRASAHEYERINHRGTDLLARTLAEHCPGATLLYASSANIYGDGPFSAPLSEASPTSPQSPYALSKLQGERAAFTYAPALRVIAFRFPALYARDWLFNVRKRAYAPQPLQGFLLRLIGSDASYSFCAIENAIAATLLAASGRMPPGVYNMADRTPYSQADVVRVVSHYDGRHWWLPVPVSAVRPLYWGLSALLPSHARTWARGAYHKFVGGMVLDCTRAHNVGYIPTITFTDLLQELPS